MVDYEVKDKEDGHASLVLRGELLGDVSSEQLKDQLERHFVDDGVVEIRADLDELTQLSLEGVAILLALWRESSERGKRFVIRHAKGQVRQELRTTGVLDMLGG